MIKCNLCGIEKATRREMNGHLLHSHLEEYRAGGCRQSEFTSGEPETPAKTQRKQKSAAKTQRKKDAPAGFRILNRNDEAEAEAYNMGYRYIDDSEMCYTSDEAKESGWI